MSTSSAGVPSSLSVTDGWSRLGSRLRASFFSDPTRTAQAVLGLIWLLFAYTVMLLTSGTEAPTVVEHLSWKPST